MQAEGISSLAEDTFLLSMTSIVEIKRDDGTSLGKYKAPPGGKPVSEVLDNISKMHRLDGVLVEDDSLHLTNSDLLTAGHTYTFWPSMNVPPPDGGVDNSEHWISVMLPPPLLALPVNAKDVQDILFPTEETCRLPVLPRVYAYYQRNHPSVVDKYLVKGDESKFCITVSDMLDSDIPPPESEADVFTDCGGAVIKRIFRAFRGSEHGFAHKVFLNLAETGATSESKSGATRKYTRPDTVVVVSDCTFLVGEDKLGRLHDAEEDLERKMMPLSQVFYGEVSGILCYAAAGTTFRWLFCSREKNLHPVSPDLDISMKTKFRCQYLLSIGRAYMLIKRMSEAVPRFAGRRAMFTEEWNTNKTRSLEWFSDNVLKKIRMFSEYCAAMNGSSLDNITKAYEVALGCLYLPTAIEAPTVRKNTYRVRIKPLGCAVLLKNEEEAKSFTRDVCTALCVLHGAGLVHRDVRLSNIVKVFRTHQLPPYYMLIDLETVSKVNHRLPPGFSSFRFWNDETLDDNSYTPRSDLYHLGLILGSDGHWISTEALEFIKGLKEKRFSDASDALQHRWLRN